MVGPHNLPRQIDKAEHLKDNGPPGRARAITQSYTESPRSTDTSPIDFCSNNNSSCPEVELCCIISARIATFIQVLSTIQGTIELI
ncbi:hypothetical protein JTE90_004707 [Oedothorax gibbosus]|uniref:Uncharacterized protein n=1 Tax=Oedothorax gibbosus TaxID=931172 RepID=A0AAV6TKG5_9ARAC|nr:hypothetical protein JTE90_004707 [Oedothorax gibbosus]